MDDTLIKTRFTPRLPQGAHDDVCTGRSHPAGGLDGQVRYAAPVAKGNGSSGRTKPAAVVIEKKLDRPRKAGLRACPFCRELFTDDETDVCPECGLAVRDLAALPPSADAAALDDEEGRKVATVPQAEPLPWHHLGRGRGLLVACALVGLCAFYLLPWATQTMPETARWTGAELAKVKPFYWSAFTAWLVLLPAVLSRRTLLKMVGARVAVVSLSALPAMQTAMMLQRPTHLVVKGIPFEFHWGPGVYATLVCSVLATLVAVRFGGRLDDVKVARGTSAGEVLH